MAATPRPTTPHGHVTPSIRRFRTMKEYMSVIRDGLTDWLNSLYNLNLSPEDLLKYLGTGVVLCHHANTWQVESGTKYRVQFSPRATHGSFQARDNVSLFINWCRHSLRFPETLLFETNDLVEGRNEHNFLICMLEVARRSSQVGLPEPVFDLPEIYVEKFANGPLSTIPLSYSDKKVPPTKPTSDSETTRPNPPVYNRKDQRTESPSNARTGNNVMTVGTTGNNVMMVLRDATGKHTVLRDRTEPVDLQAKNYQLVCADTVNLPGKDRREQTDATELHVMVGIPNDLKAKPGDLLGKSTESVVTQSKSCPVHARSASFDDIAYQYAPSEKTRAARRWSDGFQTPRIERIGVRKSPSERVLSRVIAAKSSESADRSQRQHRHDWSPRRGSLGCSVCPKHDGSEQQEALESFWERLSRPKTRRKSLPSGLPTVSENVTRPRPKSADGRFHHARRGSLPNSGREEQISIRPRENTRGAKNSHPSLNRNEPDRPRPRPSSAMAKLDGPLLPPKSGTGGAKSSYPSPDKTEPERPRARPRSAMAKLDGPTSPKSSTGGAKSSIRYPSPDRTEPERPRPRPCSAIAKLDGPMSPKSSTGEAKSSRRHPSPDKTEPERPRTRPSSAMAKLDGPVSPSKTSTEETKSFHSFQDKNESERPASRFRSAMAKVEGHVSPPKKGREKQQHLPVNEKKPDNPSVTSDNRKESLEERNSNVTGRIPLERANSFVIKERRSQSGSFSGKGFQDHSEVICQSTDRSSKKLPLIDEVNKHQGSRTAGGSTSLRQTGVSSESVRERNNTFYPTTEHKQTQRRRVSDSYAIGRSDELDVEVYEDFLKEVGKTKSSTSPGLSRRLSPSTTNRQANHDATHTRNGHTVYTETHSIQEDRSEDTYSVSSGTTSPDFRRSGLRPCTPVPSDHKLPKTVSPRQDPVPWPPSKIPRPTFYVAQVATEGPVSPSACSNAQNLQEFLDYLHTSNALQRSDSVSSTSDSSEGSTLI